MSIFSKLFNRKELPNDDLGTKEAEDLLVNGEGFDDLNSDEEDTSEEVDSHEEEGDYPEEKDDSDIEYEVVEREILPAKIICPDCGGITLEGLDFCDKCGGEL